MNCLRCDGRALEEHVREGVVIDVCPVCRGVWLDRGELEKLVARLRHDDDDDDDDDDDRWRGRDRGGERRDHDDDARDRRPPHRRGGWADTIARIFD